MIAGVLIYKYQPQIQLNRCVTAESLTAGLSAVVLFSIGLPINDTLTVCIFPFLIISASAIKGASVFNSPGLIFLGKISYSLYMIHWFFMMFVNTISTFITGNSLHENFTLSQLLPFSIIFIIFNILIASLSYRYVELPFRNGIRRIFNLNMKVI
jgi:peptidoglycan/LPS O-acetylase OafA/YrhL